MTPAELLDAAAKVAEIPDRTLGASRYLAACFLARQAVEEALDRFWERVQPGLEQCSGRVQLVALPAYLDDDGAAREVGYCWNRLSSACHHNTYELPPTEAEFESLVAMARGSVAALS